MAVKSVTASLNNTTYELSSTSDKTYTAAIPAPSSGADYSITLQTVDDAGNTVTVDKNDENYGKLLTLQVNDTEETADLRKLILKNSLGNRMLDMVAPIYDKSRVALHLFQVLGTILQPELDFVWGDFISQIFPQTATWSLRYWEDEYGILTDESKTIEQRRAYLMSVMYKKYPMTPKRLEQLVKGVTGFNCSIKENIEPNTFLVVINGYLENLSNVREELDRKSPAHLNYKIEMAILENVLMQASSTGIAVTELERYEMEVLN